MARGGKRPGAGRKPGQKGTTHSTNTEVFLPKSGRPSSYDPSYCADIVEFCRQGFSLTAFAGAIGVGRQTITDWGKAHPEFSLAVQSAKAAASFWWEQNGRRVAERGGGPGTATIIMFNLKNLAPDDYREKVAHELSGPDGGPIKTEETSARDLLAGKLARLTAGQGSPSGSCEPDGGAG